MDGLSGSFGAPHTLSVRDMVEALIAGERDPQVLTGLARGRMIAFPCCPEQPVPGAGWLLERPAEETDGL